MADEFQSFEEAVQHHNDAAEMQRHEIRRFMQELSETQLTTLIIMMDAFTGEGGPSRANYFKGMATAVMDSKFGICWACQESPCKTDHAVAEMLKKGDEVPTTQAPPVAAPGSTEPPAEPRDLQVGEDGLLSPYQIEAMARYNLDDLREEGTNKLLGFICLDCMFMRYPSIKDRAMRPPGKENCSGCIDKTKFG